MISRETISQSMDQTNFCRSKNAATVLQNRLEWKMRCNEYPTFNFDLASFFSCVYFVFLFIVWEIWKQLENAYVFHSFSIFMCVIFLYDMYKQIMHIKIAKVIKHKGFPLNFSFGPKVKKSAEKMFKTDLRRNVSFCILLHVVNFIGKRLCFPHFLDLYVHDFFVQHVQQILHIKIEKVSKT